MKRLPEFVRRHPWESSGFVLSALYRAYSMFFRSPMSTNVFSDVNYYLNIAKALKDPDFSGNPNHFTHPPGVAWLASALGVPEGRWMPVQVLFFLMSIAIPPLLAFSARRFFDRRAARFCFWAATLYAPFWQYGSFLLAELPLCFFTSLSLFAGSLLFFTRVSGRKELGLGLLLGGAAGVGLAFKITPFPGVVFLLVAVAWGLFRRQLPPGTIRKLLPAVGVFFVLLAALSVRGTLGTGKFNLGTNKFPGDFLIGHSGKTGMIEFQAGGGAWGSPTAAMRGWTYRRVVPYAMWDSQAIRDGVDWAAHNPDHMGAMNHLKASAFFFDPPWPMFAHEPFWIQSFVSTFWMGTLVYFLAVIGWWSAWRSGNGISTLLMRESLLLLPVLGLLTALLLTSAEARYRVPLDPLILLVAGAGFSRSRRPAL